jgi:hypothetical protein
MKEFYYYIRRYVTRRVRASAGGGCFELSAPERVATVCLLVDDSGTICRGVAVCSPKDQFCKKTGRGYARARAMSAQRQKFTFGWLPWYWDSRPTNTHEKGTYNAILNQREVEILENHFYRRQNNDSARNNNRPPTEWDGLPAHEGAPMER